MRADSSSPLSSAFTRYALTVALIVVFLLTRLALRPWLGLSVPYLQFLPAIMIATWFGGLGPGILATVSSGVAALYFLWPPERSFAIKNLPDLARLPLFAAIGVAISWLVESVRRSEAAHRAAATAADEHARELDAIFEAIPDAVYVGTADGISRANTAGLRMLGAGSVADLNERIGELRERIAIRSVATGERLAPEELQLARALRGEVTVEEVVAHRADTGEDVVLRSSAAPIRAGGRVVGAVSVNADVTEQRRAAVQLQEATAEASIARQRLGEVVANVPGVVWEAWGRPDVASQRIDFVSDYVTVMLGYAPEEWTSTPNFWLTVVHPDDKVRAAQEALAKFVSGAGGRSEFRWVHRDGRVLWVEAHSRVITDANGKPVGMRGVTLDVTQRKQLELERAELYEREQQARADAVAANRLKDDFLATLSHELRTPLNAILGYARMLRNGVVESSRQPRALEIVERNATALTQMVDDVLDVSRIVAGKIRLNVQPVDLPKVVEESIGTVRPAAEAKGVRIQTVIDSHAGPIAGDADRLQQVIWNLLSNAVRFTPRDGCVQVRLARVDSHVEIVVTDSGAGIPADFLPHVFERFRQADSRFSRAYGGLGLGLAISRDLVELHGGTIQAASEGTGKGATFRVVLPLMAVLQDTHAEPVREHPRAERSIPQPADVSLAGLLVLVVDDDEDAVTMMREVLEAAGATVSSAAAAAAALTVLSHSAVNALVTDLGMPEMDGFALLAEVRKSPIASIRNIPAAALTAYARSEDRIRTLSSGFQMHLAKPIDPSELVAAVAALANLKGSGG